MKKIVYILFIISTINSFSQNKKSKISKYYTCEAIENHDSIDSSLYDKLPNGKLIFAAHKSQSKIFKISTKDKGFYYVSRPVMRKIRRSIRSNKCKNIVVESLKRKSKSKIEVVRD
ncbi:hypothetical protein [uncultured Lacinutrix sp.]|uniref:hypothetical protein n=1 Tax=uncultured Lacinutrix sp. TaxID=574032 RepID=UPI002625CF19|nr:hypothetical protein [uncultured Lacinutrix sp.]